MRRCSLGFLVVMAALTPLAFWTAPPARAAPGTPLTLTLTQVKALVTESDAGLEAAGEDTADLYAEVEINGVSLPSTFDVHQDDEPELEPFWTFTADIPSGQATANIVIQIFDHDDTSPDDKADADPGAGRDLDLTLDMASGTWSGDVSSPTKCASGSGDEGVKVCFEIGTFSASNDADGDGLLDGWETGGIDVDGNGSIDVNLPAFGADPLHKDLFLELDTTPGQAPSRPSIQAIKEAFAAAPLSNPDGTAGVNIWIDTGNVVDPNAREGATADTCLDGLDNGGDGTADAGDTDCTSGNYLETSTEDPASSNCADGADNDADGPADAADADCLIGDDLGGGNTVAALNNCGLNSPPFFMGNLFIPIFYGTKRISFSSDRRWAFRYAISTQNSAGCNSGGNGEVGGNDFVDYNHDGGSIMHELGHNLNLRHGGFEDHNCKPNYVGVMNYDNQFGINRDGGGVILDYSAPRRNFSGTTRGSAPLPTLFENTLDDGTVLDASDHNNMFVFVEPGGQKVQREIDEPANWDANSATNLSDATVNIDTSGTNGSPSGCTNGFISTAPVFPLLGFNDWSQVSLPFRQFGNSATGAINPVTDQEPTLEDLLVLQQELNTTDLSIILDDSPDPVAAGTQLAYTLTVTNHGPNPANSVQVVQTLPSDVSYGSGSPGCEAAGSVVTCNLGSIPAGASKEATVTVEVPANLVYLNGGPKTITTSATVENLAGPDSAGGNNGDSEATQVIAVADLAIENLASADAPVEILIGTPVDVTVVKTIANLGPSSPIDARLTGTAAASPGASVSPLSFTSVEPALEVGAPRTVKETFSVACSEPGPHMVTFTNTIAPANAADTDPNAANDLGSLAFTAECVVPVVINVKPRGKPNSISLLEGDIPIAVLTTAAGEYGLPLAFDAITIDPLSVLFGPKAALFNVAAPVGASESHDRGHVEDSYELDERTRDGDLDMVLHFPAADTGLTPADVEACAKGSFTEPASSAVHTFLGCDAIVVRP